MKTPAKINLCLRIVGQRPDGYHLLDSVMVPIGVFDRLWLGFEASSATAIDLVLRDAAAVPVEENIVMRAARLFLERTSTRAHVKIELEKRIPVGAGMGGGSSDAAAVLLGLNELLGTGVEPARLARWGLEIGADVPFFLCGRPARIRGVGELVDPLTSWPRLALVVAFGGTGLSTAEVYRAYDRALTKPDVPFNKSVSADPQVPLREWLVNDLEAVASQVQPGIRLLKQRLLDLGALAARMTGSGAAVFGVWEDAEDARAVASRLQEEGLWGQAVEILDRRPETRRY